MTSKKRLIIILGLLVLVFAIIFMTSSYEDKIVSRKKVETVSDKYSNFKKVSYYKSINKERYVSYYENNKNLSFEKVVLYVNIGLDKEPYTYTRKADVSKNNQILVNKYHKLDQDYVPLDLEVIDSKYFINAGRNDELKRIAKESFEKLSLDSIKNGTPVYGQSAYRSYDVQEFLFNEEVKNYGLDKALNNVAKPGYSEHQTGLAIDVSSTKSGNMLEFLNTKSYEWMINNAHKYGFILRYNKNKENIHGYINEPWHYRYVGVIIATDMHDNYSDLTYEEYYYQKIDKAKN